jgi:hypothetical protein
MNHEGMLKPALVGGVLLGILSVIPVISLGNCFCCAWVIGGGVLASFLYVKSSPVAVTLGRGVALGLLAGAIGAIVDTMFSIPLQILLSRLGMGVEGVQQILDQIPQLPPEFKKAVQTALAGGKGIGVLVMLLGAFFKLVVYSAVCMLGGAIGVAVFEKRDTRVQARAVETPYRPPTDVPPPPADQPPGDNIPG